jgi:hypothetical protein
MYTKLESLQRLVEAVETAHANIAPTYHEYMPMAFGIANSCGEAGRPFFHRLCAPSPRYVAKDADRLYDNALKSGRNTNSLGTVWHLAENAGVDLRYLARPQEAQTSATFCHVAESRNAAASSQPTSYGVSAILPANEGPSYTHAHAREDVPDDENDSRILDRISEQGNPLPDGFQEYAWPRFVERGVECGETAAQRDILLLTQLAIYGEMLSPTLHFHYSHRTYYPCMQIFVMAPPASGKGVMAWVRHLGLPFHEEMIGQYRKEASAYESAMQEWSTLGKQKAQTEKPAEPTLRMLFVTGDNTGTGILENLINNEGKGIILESEADLLSAAINSDHGNWSHTLRKAFDHDGLAFNRRTNHEYRECKQSMLSVVLSGTPGQLRPLIPSAENGLFSRQLFYFMPRMVGWHDQFGEVQTDYAHLFRQWGERWKSLLTPLRRSVSSIRFTLDEAQRLRFNDIMAAIYEHGLVMYGDQMAGIVARIAVNLMRIASVIAFFRAVDALLTEEEPLEESTLVSRLAACQGLCPAHDVPAENVRDGVVSRFDLTIGSEDFEAVMSMAEPFYRHAAYVLMYLDEAEVSKRKQSRSDDFLSSLPTSFTRKEMLAMADAQGIPESTCDKMLRRLVDGGVLVKADRGTYHFTSV